MKDCDGEVKAISADSVDDSPTPNPVYEEQCNTCARWEGNGSFINRFNGEWVEVQLLGEEKPIMICKVSKNKC